ncbi:hypothetical protein HU230_0012430 [Bradyrhizobium quebecense]|uniref:Uncharacterized protein n=1 Tax=Bradyrhizobium quebecense TaxID=2748629 RepID=A0A973WTF3_9BRAD|nr:hypothetical protein [Bradyrhizobium quebecense]UGA46795.1 hypothetical protein HU230_0012430 [Bradyrhizobium quebecense]
MTDPRVPKKKRKTSPRGPSGIKKPNVAAAVRLRWQDPEYREKMRLVNERNKAERKLNPQKYTRTRVPDGMRKAEAQKKWAKAEQLAERFIKMLEDEGDIPAVTVPGSDEEMATRALREAFTLAVAPGDQKIQTANIRTVLEWTRAKPESKSKVTVEKAEDWLAAAQADMARGD